GVAVLVAITSFSKNLEQTMDRQSRVLLGADLAIRSRQPFADETVALLASLGGEQARQVSFASMVYFPESGATRLATVRALEGGFPFYGRLETEPENAAGTFRSGANAIVDDGLMLQFDVQVGNAIKVGAETFRIAGRLKKIPGETLAIGLVQPRVYIPMASLQETGLIRKGSIVTYHAFFKFDEGRDVRQLVKEIAPDLVRLGLRADTVERRKERLGGIMENLSRFLNLVGFLALLLGGVGVASAVHVYTKQKMATVAILRCVGARSAQTLAIYLLQAMITGLVGTTLGLLGGLVLQRWLPGILGDFLPMEIVIAPSASSVLLGLLVGMVTAVLFALLPLVSLKHVSPLLALRASFEDVIPVPVRRAQAILYLLIGVGIGFFAVAQTERWSQGLGFTAGLALACGLLVGLARMLMLLVRRFFPQSWGYVWRQGLANLYRPDNQTTVLMLSLGLGTFLIMTLQFCHRMLLDQVVLAGGGERPNLVLFDVQPEQRRGLAELLGTFQLPVLQETPIVTMRLLSVKGQSVNGVREDPESRIPRWALRREYRSTYRDRLVETEKIVRGSWNGEAKPSQGEVRVSLEEGIAEDLRVEVGDELVFDVYGEPIRTRVGSIRKVNWRRFQPNFFVVFPAGVLEQAPQFYVQVTRVPTEVVSAQLQRAVVQAFPNVSAIDLSLVLSAVDAILTRVSLALRFVALFSLLTGLVVLASAVLTSRYQRFVESVLLRTLGATRAQVRNIMLVEYLLLGVLAALAGTLLAMAASWALAYYLFETAYVPSAGAVGASLVVVTGLTLCIGMLNSRGICDRSPLEVLRAET
ncbi:MAG TPA: FtsX-like permease family protein, partial [Candidatus Binatia bacterium]